MKSEYMNTLGYEHPFSTEEDYKELEMKLSTYSLEELKHIGILIYESCREAKEKGKNGVKSEMINCPFCIIYDSYCSDCGYGERHGKCPYEYSSFRKYYAHVEIPLETFWKMIRESGIRVLIDLPVKEKRFYEPPAPQGMGPGGIF